MDISGFIKQYAAEIGRFLEHQFRVWLGLIRRPVDVLEPVDLNSGEVLYRSLGLATFVYLVILLIALPPQFAGDSPGLPSMAEVVVDAVTTFLGFASVGASLWISGRVLGAHTGPVACFSTGFFMTAAWPFVQLSDWVLSGAWQESLAPGGQLALLGAVVVVVIGFAIYWAAPIVAHVHKFGRGRANLATLLQLFLIGAIWTYILEDRFPGLGS